MTPKEKAQELVDKFMDIKNVKLSDYSVIYLPTAKQCALITVNYIMSSNPHSNLFDTEGKSTISYWMLTKQEIQNL